MPKGESLSIKKRNATNLFWGKHTSTGKMMSISEVEQDLACGCICAYCETPLIARKGKIRIPHFAHQSNYDCMYANEVAIYQIVSEVLGSCKGIMLPRVTLSFPTWAEKITIQEKRILPIDEPPEYYCSEKQYPPTLLVTIQRRKLRLILDFDSYYDKHDLSQIKHEEQSQRHGCIRYRFPAINDSAFYSREHLLDVIEQGVEAEWVYSPLENLWREKCREAAIAITRYQNRIYCPLHKERAGNRYCVGLSACLMCSHNISENSECLCLAVEGYLNLDDFKLSPKERRSKLQQIQQNNEKRLQQEEETRRLRAKQKAENERKRRRKQEEEEQRRKHEQESFMERQRLEQEQYLREKEKLLAEEEAEYNRIRKSFNVHSKKATTDKFGNRYIMCERCGIIKKSYDMAIYGGPNSMNIGLCTQCSRKEH